MVCINRKITGARKSQSRRHRLSVMLEWILTNRWTGLLFAILSLVLTLCHWTSSLARWLMYILVLPIVSYWIITMVYFCHTALVCCTHFWLFSSKLLIQSIWQRPVPTADNWQVLLVWNACLMSQRWTSKGWCMCAVEQKSCDGSCDCDRLSVLIQQTCMFAFSTKTEPLGAAEVWRDGVECHCVVSTSGGASWACEGVCLTIDRDTRLPHHGLTHPCVYILTARTQTLHAVNVCGLCAFMGGDVSFTL